MTILHAQIAISMTESWMLIMGGVWVDDLGDRFKLEVQLLVQLMASLTFGYSDWGPLLKLLVSLACKLIWKISHNTPE